MPSKNATRAKTAKTPGRDKRRSGLTSAIGPKATTIVVIVVMGGGIMLGAYQRSAAAKAKSTTPAMEATADTMPEAPAHSKKPVVARVQTSESFTPARSSAASATPKAPVTTIVGCLERNGDGFRLKNTSGDDAPKTRSWKSGFMKKGAAAVDVVDATDSLGLPNRVGQRVSVSGSLVDREMQARSVRRVAASCN